MCGAARLSIFAPTSVYTFSGGWLYCCLLTVNSRPVFVMYTFTGAVQFWEYGQGSAFYEHNQMNSGWGFFFLLPEQ